MDNVVEIVEIEDGDYFVGSTTQGGTVNVTLRRGDAFVRCEGILIFEEEDFDEVADEIFEEWMEDAKAGEEGYTTWVA